MWFSGLRETNWKPFGAFNIFFLEDDGCGLSGAMVDRGQQMGAAATLLFYNRKKLKDSKGFQFVSLRPENHIFCFKVPEMPLKAHASSAVGAKNR